MLVIRVEAWEPHSHESKTQLAAVLSLHKANRAWLGPMPDTAFRDRARHDGLLLGYVDDTIAGYVLYDIPRSYLIKLIHVCVADSSRGSGLAHAMVDAAIDRNPLRSMITASCRTDYGIDSFWESLGMHAASERKGRALGGSILINWAKRIHVDNGLDLLESASLESGLPIAVLDTNVVGDLFSPSEVRRDNREQSSELLADWLQPLVNFAVSGEVDNEISRNPDRTVRTHLQASSQMLTRLSTLRPSDRSLEDSLLASTDPTLLAQDDSLRQDILHVADAIHAGADYFVTNDENVHIAGNGWPLARHRIKLVRPHQLIAALSPQSYMTDFRSSLIDDGDLEWLTVTDEDPALDVAFRDYETETKPSVFTRRLRELLAKRRTTTVQKLVDGSGSLWALAAVELEGSTLRIRMLRAIRGERGGTVSFQLLRHFRRVAWEHGATRIEMQDPAISPTLDAALKADGFRDGSTRSADLGPASETARSLGLASHADVALAERRNWPLVVREASLPTFIVPIQPRWASRLLGVDEGLFTVRRRGLGLARELVYFSGSRIVPKSLPARLLWYSSTDKSAASRSIVARSVLVDATRLPADEAVSRFLKLGVLRKSEIEATADKTGTVSVVRFQDTEILQQPVRRSDPLFKRYVKGEVMTMRSVEPQMFDDVMASQGGEPV